METPSYPTYTEGELDPQAIQFLTAIAVAELPPLADLTPQLARERNIVDAFMSRSALEIIPSENEIPGPYGSIPLRIFTPSGEGPFPVLIYFHGGGWVVGKAREFDPLCGALCHGAHCIIVSVDYRLAPECKFPVALEEGYAVLQWLALHAAEIGAEPARIAVGGDSAGGNMAAVLAQLSKTRKGPPLVFQLLICPATNLTDFENRSYRDFGTGIWLPVELMKWYINQYIQMPEDVMNPLVSPILAEDLSGLPPAFILTAEFDVLRDEAEA
ncbi:MAG: alpha/beta hydrolase, partial [bacterium]